MKGKRVPPGAAQNLCAEMLKAYGASEGEADIVSSHLIEADMCGVSSHGILRLPQYVDQLIDGRLVGGAHPRIIYSSDTIAVISGERAFGQVACALAMNEGVDRARRDGISLTNVVDAGHAGRLGAYAESLGRAGLLSLLFCSGPLSAGHFVAPFNGRAGRLGTNPIAFSIPTKGHPIVGDFSTATAPEGRIRRLRNEGELAPPETLIDAFGQPTRDPNVLYENLPGAILPFGGPRAGHRGFALGLLVEAFGTLLGGEKTTDSLRSGNNVAMVIVAVDSEFAERAQDMADYVLTCPAAGDTEIVLPGAPEEMRRRVCQNIEIEQGTWDAIVERAEARDLRIEGFTGTRS